MTARRLGKCPTCYRALDDATRLAMGLRNGEALNAQCPGLNGPSDIDHVLHNGHRSPERIMFLEYKDGGARISGGQLWVLKALRGDWLERNTGRELAIRFVGLPLHPTDPHEAVRGVVEWVWPAEDARGAA